MLYASELLPPLCKGGGNHVPGGEEGKRIINYVMVATCISPLYCTIYTGVHWFPHEVHRPVHQLISLIQDPTIGKTETPVGMATQWGEWLDIWGEGRHCSWEAQDCTHPDHLSYPHLHQQKLCCSFLLHLMLQNLDLPISWQEGTRYHADGPAVHLPCLAQHPHHGLYLVCPPLHQCCKITTSICRPVHARQLGSLLDLRQGTYFSLTRYVSLLCEDDYVNYRVLALLRAVAVYNRQSIIPKQKHVHCRICVTCGLL